VCFCAPFSAEISLFATVLLIEKRNQNSVKSILAKNGATFMQLKTLKSIEDFEQLTAGQAIFVSNGEEEPPKHHTRKHKSWGFRNYQGFVHRFGFSAGRYEIVIGTSRSSVMVSAYGIDQFTFQVEV